MAGNESPGPASSELRGFGVQLAAVFIGGAVGTAARYCVDYLYSGQSNFPWPIWMINITGAFALGLLAQVLPRTRLTDSQQLVLRNGIGSGLIGGFTTYSLLAMDTASLATSGQVEESLSYAISTLVVGTAAAGLGMILGNRGRLNRV